MIRMFPLALLLAACGTDDPAETPPAEGEGEGDCTAQTAPALGGGVTGACDAADDAYPAGWDACVSDDGTWHLAGEDHPSSAARVAAYEAIGELLWNNECVPSSEDFVTAQGIYGEDGGVGSRVARRYDAHLDKPADADCKAEDAAQKWPDYCVGPAKIEPMILDAFAKGIAGEDPGANALKIRSALLWFYFVSTYKEAFTCADKAKDCDSAWAYFTGGKQEDETQLGLAGEVHALDPAVHAAVFDALLAVRCWRDLDSAEQAEDDALHQRALAELDRALNRAWEVVAVPDVPSVSDACE